MSDIGNLLAEYPLFLRAMSEQLLIFRTLPRTAFARNAPPLIFPVQKDMIPPEAKTAQKRLYLQFYRLLPVCYNEGMQKDSLKTAVTLVVLYTGFIFAGFHWMLTAKIDPIEKLLTNHITDTNKKIEKLSERFDDLYKFLLEEKKKK